jgi:hypothetical protein
VYVPDIGNRRPKTWVTLSFHDIIDVKGCGAATEYCFKGIIKVANAEGVSQISAQGNALGSKSAQKIEL